jgi:hypothetical protein
LRLAFNYKIGVVGQLEIEFIVEQIESLNKSLERLEVV